MQVQELINTFNQLSKIGSAKNEDSQKETDFLQKNDKNRKTELINTFNQKGENGYEVLPGQRKTR